MDYVRDAVHHGFERNRDLLLDLLGGNSGPLSDDFDVVVGHVGIGLDRQIVERDDAPDKQHKARRQNQQAIVQSAKSTTRRIIILSPYCSTVFCRSSAFATTFRRA